MFLKWYAYVFYCGYKYASTKPQGLAKSFHWCEQYNKWIQLCTKLDINSIVALVSFCTKLYPSQVVYKHEEKSLSMVLS